jgi:hypothetical protein
MTCECDRCAELLAFVRRTHAEVHRLTSRERQRCDCQWEPEIVSAIDCLANFWGCFSEAIEEAPEGRRLH